MPPPVTLVPESRYREAYIQLVSSGPKPFNRQNNFKDFVISHQSTMRKSKDKKKNGHDDMV